MTLALFSSVVRSNFARYGVRDKGGVLTLQFCSAYPLVSLPVPQHYFQVATF